MNPGARFLETLCSADPALRNRSVEELAAGCSAEELWQACLALDAFRRQSPNLYERVRALFLEYAICRFFLPSTGGIAEGGLIPPAAHSAILDRRFAEAIDVMLGAAGGGLPGDALCSGLAAAFAQLGLEQLAGQVRRSVRSVRGNQWMFRCGHPSTHPLRLRPELLRRAPGGVFPVLHEKTPVRMD
ncbi:MAG: hypothetical protein N2322_06045, partial [Terrimicrobiaceae bacterium]|nr:hypothetical protein [Terrimicrobiaceae bacterium]